MTILGRDVEIIDTESRFVVREGNGSVTLDLRFNDQPTFGQCARFSAVVVAARNRTSTRTLTTISLDNISRLFYQQHILMSKFSVRRIFSELILKSVMHDDYVS